MNVFADFHHGGLYHSLSLLFENRLKGTLYSPVGEDWAKEGYWRYTDDPSIIKEYLVDEPEKSHTKGWLSWDRYEPIKEAEGIYSMMEAGSRFKLRRLTLAEFKKMEFDYIVPTIYNHEESFLKLRDKFQPKAKMIRNFGNADEITTGKVKNLLNSTANWPTKPDWVSPLNKEGFNHVLWRQEMDTSVFKWSPPTNHKRIESIMPFPKAMLDYPTWKHHKNALCDFEWKQHGLEGDDGNLPERDLGQAFKDTGFIWQVKFRGDGYGHTIHHAYACGRPCIVRGSYYKDCLADDLLIHEFSCIDLEKMSYREFLDTMRRYSEPENHLAMCRNAYNIFKSIVDFDKEFDDVKLFLERCK